MEKALSPNSVLQNGKYKIIKILGQGSFGITYLATTKLTMSGQLGQMETTVYVAIKEFFMHETNSRSSDGSSVDGSNGSLFSNYRNKFKKEAINLSHLNHPNIVKVIEIFDENNTTYYVMQYIDGESLDEYIFRNNGIKETEALSLLLDIGNALQYMHSNKMLHLDLKPKNIMIDKGGKCFLIDFGLSKQFSDEGEPESSTTIGAGTPGYAPLEQANFKREGSLPMTLDVYALGATFFKMLTGRKPQHFSEILEDGLDEDSLIKKGVSLATVTVIKKAMAPVKKNRYQTVSEFLSDLNLTVIPRKRKAPSTKKRKTLEAPEDTKEVTVIDIGVGSVRVDAVGKLHERETRPLFDDAEAMPARNISQTDISHEKPLSAPTSKKSKVAKVLKETEPLPTLSFSDAILLVMAKMNDFKGRSRRSEFNWVVLPVLLYPVIFFYHFYVRIPYRTRSLFYEGWDVSILVLGIICSYLGLGVTIRRLHDIDKSGLWAVIPFAALVICVIIYFNIFF